MADITLPTTGMKPCPFCGAALLVNDDVSDLYVRRYGAHYEHPDNGCWLSGDEVRPSEVESWNTRTDGVQAHGQSVTVETLRQHWLRAMECDHATGRDKPHCSCSLVDLGWHPSVGAAVEAWLAHVAGVPAVRGGEQT